MYIIHYSLGFPPYRIGGLTKFCMDIMDYQISQGYRVALLWPGQIIGRKTKIRYSKVKGYESFEIINPLPISICNGIKNDKEYTRRINPDVFETFLDFQKPDCIHVHTLEGLPIEFLKIAKSRNIKLIYSTHDLFGICPTNTLYNEFGVCNVDCIECVQCNQNAFSMNKIKIMQSLPYRVFKNTSVLTLLRKKIRKDANASNTKMEKFDCDYAKLKQYYKDCFNMFNLIHCNSSVTYDVFSKYMGDTTLKKINITNSSIVDNRKNRVNKISEKINLLYLGVEVQSKGFYFLINILDELSIYRNDFKLIVYSQDDRVQRNYIEKHGVYTYQELESVYENADLLVVPSLRIETFGFVTVEAYYHGVPALVMDNVGSKDIINNGETGFISTKINFKNSILEILENKRKLFDISENIKKVDLNISTGKMCDEIYKGL